MPGKNQRVQLGAGCRIPYAKVRWVMHRVASHVCCVRFKTGGFMSSFTFKSGGMRRQLLQLPLVLTALGVMLVTGTPLSAVESKAPLKLLRYGPVGKEKPALIDQNGVMRDLSRVIPDITPAQLSPESMARLAAINTSKLPRVADGQRIGMPIKDIGKIVGVGLNYVEHARGTKAAP